MLSDGAVSRKKSRLKWLFEVKTEKKMKEIKKMKHKTPGIVSGKTLGAMVLGLALFAPNGVMAQQNPQKNQNKPTQKKVTVKHTQKKVLEDNCVNCEIAKATNKILFEKIEKLRLEMEALEKRLVTDCSGKQDTTGAVKKVCAPSFKVSVDAKGKEHKFIRDTSIPALGEAYRDDKGLIWGDVAKDKDGEILEMSHRKALAYCENINKDFPKFEIRLPTKEEFTRLRDNLGSKTGNKIFESAEGYSPKDKSGKDILPNLSKDWFWSSSSLIHPDYSSNPRYGFLGSSGDINVSYRRNNFNGAVRCVASRR